LAPLRQYPDIKDMASKVMHDSLSAQLPLLHGSRGPPVAKQHCGWLAGQSAEPMAFLFDTQLRVPAQALF
jgi:hypothetical protein